MGTAAYGGKGFKERTRGCGERPIGADRCRQQSAQASCRPSPPADALYDVPQQSVSSGNSRWDTLVELEGVAELPNGSWPRPVGWGTLAPGFRL